ncbi:DUF445 domain-containing protein [bacterium]|nr:DUF445 domain-containing protein [bacterium]
MFQKSNEPDQHFLTQHKGEISFAIALSGLIVSSLFMSYAPPSYLAFLLVVQTGFEAGTVGGAADWLAVKMIFDEIKIGNVRIVPASGIIPRKQKAIAQAAGKLVADEWLSPQSVKKILQSVDVAGALADYLEKIKQNGELSGHVSWLIQRLTKILEKPGAKEKLAGILNEQVTRIQWSQWIGSTLTDDQARKILDQLVPFFAEKLTELLSTQEAFDLIVEKLSEDKGGFLKQLFFDPVETAEKTILKSIQFLRELQDNPYHPVRLKIDTKTVAWINELRTDSESAKKIDKLAAEITSELEFTLLAEKAINRLIEFLNEQRHEKDGLIYRTVSDWVDNIILELRNNSEWQKTVNENVISVIGEVINRNHHLIGEMVEKNLSSLSPEQIKEQFRIRTYNDMQWIRVNGAVAGFAIGVVIGIIRVLLS